MACTDINSEDRLVQKTFAEHLHDKLGWDSAYAWNNEVFGTLQPSPHPSRSGRASEGGGVACDLGRTDTREVVLTRDLRAALERLNPLLPPAAITEAIQEITRHDFTRSLLQHNQAFYKLIRDGVPVSYKDANGVQRDARARVIDFKNERGADGQPNNRFLAVRELKITGLRTPGYNRRADIVCFVNGLPLVFIELKAIYKNIRRGFDDNLRDYMQQDTIPHAFHHNAFLIVSNGHRARYGSITSGWEHFAEWKRLAESDKGSVEAEVLLNGMLSHERLLDIVENFILFDGSKPGGTRKIVASNHQVLGVNNAVASVRRHISAKFTFLLMTDRNDLDGQLYKTFVGCGIVEAEATPRASSGKDLERLLKENHRYIFSLIHKFNQDVDPREPYSKRDDIIVISDEAHRTQAGRLARNMRLALPNAAFIGFTGTPLFKHDHLTKRIFGGYGSKYDFKRLRTARTQLSIHATRDGVGLRFWRGRFSSGSKHWLQGSRRMPMQRELFTVLPTPPFTEDEKAVMAQRVYQHIWQQSTSGLFWVTA